MYATRKMDTGADDKPGYFLDTFSVVLFQDTFSVVQEP